MKPKLLTTLAAILIALSAWANGTEINGIYYELDSSTMTASVTKLKNSEENSLVTINLINPGTLQETILDIEETSIRHLKIVGTINSADMNYLRTSALLKDLIYLDMSEVVLMADNQSYCFSKDFGNLYFYFSDDNYYYQKTHDSGLGFYISTTHYYSNSFAGSFMDMNVQEVVLPSHLTRIGAYSFANCKNLQKIIIPSGVTTIETCAFYGCKSLQRIDLPPSVTTIEGGAFNNCEQLITVASMDNVTEIGAAAFAGCESLDYVGNLANVKVLGASCFSGCSRLISLNLSNVSIIPDRAFFQCANLSDVVFSDNMQSIGESAFEECTDLHSVKLAETTKAVSARAFLGCKRLNSVTYSKNLLEVSQSTFLDTPFFESMEYDDGIKYMEHIAICPQKGYINLTFREGTLSIANDFSAKYKYSSYCDKLIFPSSLLRIGDRAFENFGITKLSLPENMLEIGDGAFRNCESISQVTLPESLTYIGNASFKGCQGLARVTYNANVSTINKSPYNESSHYYWENGIFAETNIEKVIIGSKVRILPHGLFYNCDKLIKVEFAERTADEHLYVGEYSFFDCDALKSIVLPYKTDSIGSYAFFSCSGLTSVTIPNSVTSIGRSAFQSCTSLTSITIPSSVTSIGDYAFEGCTGLTSITIPNSVTSIGRLAFRDCTGLTSVTIGNSVTSIGDWAFYECTGLTDIYALRTDPEAYNCATDGFLDVPTSTCTLHVPKGSEEAYASTQPWSKFASIVEEEDLTAIQPLTLSPSEAGESYYNLQGQRITNPQRGQLVIIRYADGTSRKVVVD